MLMSEYLEHARIHIDDDHAVLLFSFENKEYGLAVAVELIEALLTDDAGGMVVMEPTNDYKERNDYE
jgi:LDH2 family malate/lactate/ureidoglycolate dehydrogenase